MTFGTPLKMGLCKIASFYVWYTSGNEGPICGGGAYSIPWIYGKGDGGSFGGFNLSQKDPLSQSSLLHGCKKMGNTHILETTSQWLLFCLLAAIIQKTTNHGSRMTETINIIQLPKTSNHWSSHSSHSPETRFTHSSPVRKKMETLAANES